MKLRLVAFVLVLLVLLLPAIWMDRTVEAVVWLFLLTVVACLLVLLTAIVDTVRGARLAVLTKIWMRRKQDGQCLRCGYDLRGSRNRCPECGTLAGTSN